MPRACLAALVVTLIAVPPAVVWFNREPPGVSRPEVERMPNDPRAKPDERPPGPAVGPEWKGADESIDLPAGLKARAAYHFNRNALRTACIADGGLLAVTDSGNLLRFDLTDLRLQQELRPDAAITHLISANGVGVLAADAGGRVFRIDPKTLKQTEFAKLPAAPRWMIGFRDASKQRDGVLAVVPSDAGGIELHRLGFGRPISETHKLPELLAFNGGISAYFLDSKSRLWLGKDGGEWSGWCGQLDLNAGAAGKVEAIEKFYRNVYGFVELPDGQVWAYGGLMHLGLCSGYIARVDRGKVEELGSFRRNREDKEGTPPKRPRYPITHVIPDPAGNGVLVFAYRDLFRADAKLTNWRHLGSIDLRYRWGRPDAMGSYPALRTVHAVGDAPGDLICTTARDGLLRVRDGRVTPHVIPGQIEDDRIRTILPATGTTLLRGEELWKHAGGSWETISLFPPAPPSPRESWYEYGLMLDPDRRPVALCRSNSNRGPVALTRLKDGKVEVFAGESERAVSFSARGGFATPDGGYWCADRENLLRLVDGKWQQVGAAPGKFLWGLRVVGEGKPPWILHCDDSLYRLTPGEGGRDAVLAPVPLPAEAGLVHDALALDDGKILLACSAGLRLFDVKSGKVTECPFAPKGDVQAVCRDGRGRIWLAGSGLWIVDATGAVHDLGALNRYGVAARAIGADTADATGVIVALDGRGVLRVRAERGAD